MSETAWSSKWDDSTLALFEPERWLVANEKGELQFDSRAGPMHTFGAGLRGCFGTSTYCSALTVDLDSNSSTFMLTCQNRTKAGNSWAPYHLFAYHLELRAPTSSPGADRFQSKGRVDTSATECVCTTWEGDPTVAMDSVGAWSYQASFLL